jgi:hypothetical protein
MAASSFYPGGVNATFASRMFWAGVQSPTSSRELRHPRHYASLRTDVAGLRDRFVQRRAVECARCPLLFDLPTAATRSVHSSTTSSSAKISCSWVIGRSVLPGSSAPGPPAAPARRWRTVPPDAPQVLAANLNCSESRHPWQLGRAVAPGIGLQRPTFFYSAATAVGACTISSPGWRRLRPAAGGQLSARLARPKAGADEMESARATNSVCSLPTRGRGAHRARGTVVHQHERNPL